MDVFHQPDDEGWVYSCDICQVCATYTVIVKRNKLSWMLIHKRPKVVADCVFSGH